MATRKLPLRVPNLKVKYEAPRKVPENLPNLHILAGVCGSRGSGKTTAMLQLFTMYNETKTFDRTFVVCPTYDSDPKYALFETFDTELHVYREFTDAIWREIEADILAEVETYKAHLEALRVWRKFMRTPRLEELNQADYQLLADIGFEEPKCKWKQMPTTAIVLDDLAGSSAYRADCKGPLNYFAVRHRHARTSIFFSVQTLSNSIPKQLRCNLSLLILFRCKSKNISKTAAEEYSSYVSSEEFQAYWEHATREPHSFLLCNFEAPAGEQFRMGFDQMYTSVPQLEASDDEPEKVAPSSTPSNDNRK